MVRMAISAIPSSTAMLAKSPFARRAMAAAAAATSRRGSASLHRASTAAASARDKKACGRGGSTSFLAAPAAAAETAPAVVVSRRPMSSDTTGGGSGSSGRFSDDLEKLISRAGERVDRSGVAKAAAGEEGDGPGEGVEVKQDSNLSARAMKFRAMISKLRPQKKAVVVKVCVYVPRSCVVLCGSSSTTAVHTGRLTCRVFSDCTFWLILAQRGP